LIINKLKNLAMNKELLKRIEKQILQTPTGELRELLTDINIALRTDSSKARVLLDYDDKIIDTWDGKERVQDQISKFATDELFGYLSEIDRSKDFLATFQSSTQPSNFYLPAFLEQDEADS